MASFWMGGPHPTSNLAGYPARDYGAPGGTPLYGWTELRVRQISGAPGYRGKGFGGHNLYLVDRRGKEYFATHLEGLRVKVGSIIRPGQQVAVIGDYGTPHVHIGYTGGDPSTTLGLKPEYLFTPGGAVAGAKAIEGTSPKGGGGVTGFIKGLPSVSGIDLIEGATGKDLPDIDTNPVDVITAPMDAVRWLVGNWDRVAEVLGGFLLLVVGLVIMGRSLGVTKTKIEIVESRLPGGAQRLADRDAAAAEAKAYSRAAAKAGRERAAPSAGPRRRRVRLPSDEPPPRRAPVATPAGQDEIPF